MGKLKQGISVGERAVEDKCRGVKWRIRPDCLIDFHCSTTIEPEDLLYLYVSPIFLAIS